ncbi:MAG: hypothetical protein K2P68_11850 [Sphingomonas sp.]|nr:hypothetical protein [Sphingomonas sp.]
MPAPLRVIGPLALLVLGAARDGAANGGTGDLEQALAGRAPGAPVRCINNASAAVPQIIDRSTLIYRSGVHLWRNTLPSACPSLAKNAILIVDLYGTQLCRNDRFRTITPNAIIASGTCRLGDFVPYSLVKTPAPATN